MYEMRKELILKNELAGIEVYEIEFSVKEYCEDRNAIQRSITHD